MATDIRYLFNFCWKGFKWNFKCQLPVRKVHLVRYVRLVDVSY
jgi:hypothetical protein